MDLRACLPSSLSESEKDAILHSLEEPRGESALLLNTDKIKDEEFLRRYPDLKKHPFVEHAYLYDREQYPFGKSIYYENGAISIEDGAAMMVVNYFLRPEEDDVLLDICAAPGGKSIGASLFMNDKGCIVANDVSYPRAKAMSQNVERMGRGNIVCASNDFLFSKIHFAETFDKILVDAPCSGTAMFRKSEASRRDWRIEKAKSCHTRQVDLLEEAYSMLKPGGILAYSTCSFVELENEGSVLAFKELHPEAEVIDLPDDPTFYRNPKLPGAVTLYPNRFPYGEGQFICLLRKPGTLVKTPRKVVEAKEYGDFLEQYGLVGRSNEKMREKFYSLYQHFDASHLNILRYGVKLFEVRTNRIYIPDHHLTHFLDDSYSIPIGEAEMKAYIGGLTFPLDLADGYYIVSYDAMNLGFVKVVGGVAKNHYPKGLRKNIELF